MDRTALRIVKELNIIQLWLFIALRSLCDKSGFVRSSYDVIRSVVRGARIDADLGLIMTIDQVRRRLGELAYLGVVEYKEGAEPNTERKYIQSEYPVRIRKKFLDLMPNKQISSITEEDFVLLKDQVKKEKEHAKNLNAMIRKLRDENKLIRANNLPEFKLINKDGTINKRSAEFQRMWAWFVLLGIQKAFEKIAYKLPEQPSIEPDYQIMAVWLSYFGLESIEGLFSKLYMNKRLDEIKDSAGNDWTGAVVKYIFASLKGISKQNKDEDKRDDYAKRYVPASGWEVPDKYRK